jgi:hypothetical protein
LMRRKLRLRPTTGAHRQIHPLIMPHPRATGIRCFPQGPCGRLPMS